MLSAEVIMIVSSVLVTLGTAAALMIVSNMSRVRLAQADLAATLTHPLTTATAVGDKPSPSSRPNNDGVLTANYTATPILSTTAVPTAAAAAVSFIKTIPTVTATPIIGGLIVMAMDGAEVEVDLETENRPDDSYQENTRDSHSTQNHPTQDNDNPVIGGLNSTNR